MRVAKPMTKSEMRQRRAWLRAISGFMDFFASIGSFIIILLCVVLLVNLFGWLKDDIMTTLKPIETLAVEAIVTPEETD